MINFIHCGGEKRVYRFRSGNKLGCQLMLEKDGASYLAVQVTLTQFSNVKCTCKQSQDTFIRMDSPKIDFYFGGFKYITEKLCFELSHWSNIAQIRWPEFTEINSYFYSFTYKKTYLAVHLTSGGQVFCEFIDRQKSCRFNINILSTSCWRYKPGFYYFLLA